MELWSFRNKYSQVSAKSCILLQWQFFCSVVTNTASARASSPETDCAKVLDDILACLAITSTSDQMR